MRSDWSGAALAALRQGPKAWNSWRDDHFWLVVVDLSGAELKLHEKQMGAIHGGPVNLSRVCLAQARLDFATLTEANLEAADLSSANLAHARLRRANLTYADLRDTVFDHADLGGARLMRANLSGARLHRALNLTENQLYGTIGDENTSLPPHMQAPEYWFHSRKPEPQLHALGGLDTGRRTGWFTSLWHG